jgi:hypothetical protein
MSSSKHGMMRPETFSRLHILAAAAARAGPSAHTPLQRFAPPYIPSSSKRFAPPLTTNASAAAACRILPQTRRRTSRAYTPCEREAIGASDAASASGDSTMSARGLISACGAEAAARTLYLRAVTSRHARRSSRTSPKVLYPLLSPLARPV